MWIYVYDTAGGSGSNVLDNVTAQSGPITGANFAPLLPLFTGSSVTGSSGWYQLALPPNTNFSCTASGYNTVYTNTNGYTQMAIGLQKTGGK